MRMIHLASDAPDTPPLDPTAQHARAQLLQELSKPQYQPGRPTAGSLVTNQLQKWFQNLLDWLQSLFGKGGFGVGQNTVIVVVIVAVIILAAAIVGFFLFGVPRLNRRRAARGSLFGEEDDRDSTTLRRAAERAAAGGDYTTAIEEQFRSIARGLAERVVVTTFPGTTARGFAVDAGDSFPLSRTELMAAADSFDSVRYLGRDGTESEWIAVSALERALRATRPVLAEVGG
jgi:hypothetical protein